MNQYHEDLVNKLSLWKDYDERKKLIKEDMQIRKKQDRIRKPLNRRVS